jgi:hypothetical protein
MRFILQQSLLFVALGASTAFAGIGGTLPANPCPENAKFKTNLGVLNVNGDGSLGAGACGNLARAETAIICTSKEKSGNTIDIAIEYFDFSGATISASPLVVNNNLYCGIDAGETLTFHTAPAGNDLPLPWRGGSPGFVPTTPVVPLAACAYDDTGCFLGGSARILATSKKIECTAVMIDLSGPCSLSTAGAVASKKLTIINKAKQAGD